MMNIREKSEAFVHKWLIGFTCSHEAKKEVFWISDDEEYVIMKHPGHSTYCGRALGVLYCNTYYELHIFDPSMHDERTFLQKWEGRWNKYKLEEAKKKIKEIEDGKKHDSGTKEMASPG